MCSYEWSFFPGAKVAFRGDPSKDHFDNCHSKRIKKSSCKVLTKQQWRFVYQEVLSIDWDVAALFLRHRSWDKNQPRFLPLSLSDLLTLGRARNEWDQNPLFHLLLSIRRCESGLYSFDGSNERSNVRQQPKKGGSAKAKTERRKEMAKGGQKGRSLA